MAHAQIPRALRVVAATAFRLLPRGIPLPILAGPLRGSPWLLGAAAGEAGGASVLANLCEPEQLARAASLVGPGDVCFDLGANVGLYTLLMAKRAARVVAFEPVPRNIRYLHRMVELNRLDNVLIVPLAVSDREGVAALDPGENPTVGRLDDTGRQPVGTVTIDGFAARFGLSPTVLKIDVEGAELAVLRGAASLLRERRPRLLLSLHGDHMRDACTQLLNELGYRIEAVTGNGMEIVAL